MKAATAYLSKQSPLLLAGAAVLVVGALYFLARKAIKDAAGAVGGVVSGNNALTEGTAYQGAGIGGTLGALTNSAVPFLDNVGEWIAGVIPVKDTLGSMTYYAVTFPDGARHAVGADTIARDGTFTYKGTRYVLGTQGGAKVARYAS